MSPEPIDLEAIERRLACGFKNGDHAKTWHDCFDLLQEVERLRAEIDATKARGLDTIALYARERDEARAERDALRRDIENCHECEPCPEHGGGIE